MKRETKRPLAERIEIYESTMEKTVWIMQQMSEGELDDLGDIVQELSANPGLMLKCSSSVIRVYGAFASAGWMAADIAISKAEEQEGGAA